MRSGQAPIDYPEQRMDDLPEHDVLRIELVFVDEFPQSQKDEMRWAADLWELAFTKELDDYQVPPRDRDHLSEYISSLSVGAVRVPGVVDDVLVYVFKVPDDVHRRIAWASVLATRLHDDPASCRPAFINGNERLEVDPSGHCKGPTAIGAIHIVNPKSHSVFDHLRTDYTFAHEIGHVLGIGSTWLQYIYRASETGETYWESDVYHTVGETVYFGRPHDRWDGKKHRAKGFGTYLPYYMDAPHVNAAFAEMNDVDVQRDIMIMEDIYYAENIDQAASLGRWPSELVPMELGVTGLGPLQHWPKFPLGNSIMSISRITGLRISKVDLGVLADIGYQVGESPTRPMSFQRAGFTGLMWGRPHGKINTTSVAVHWCGGVTAPLP